MTVSPLFRKSLGHEEKNINIRSHRSAFSHVVKKKRASFQEPELKFYSSVAPCKKRTNYKKGRSGSPDEKVKKILLKSFSPAPFQSSQLRFESSFEPCCGDLNDKTKDPAGHKASRGGKETSKEDQKIKPRTCAKQKVHDKCPTVKELTVTFKFLKLGLESVDENYTCLS